MPRAHRDHRPAHRSFHRSLAAVAFAALSIVTAACGSSSSSPTAPSPADTPAPTATAVPAATTPVATAATPLTAAQLEMLSDALQDEHHAKAVYDGVIADFGRVLPFTSVVVAEQTHAASISRLFTNRGLTPPAGVWNVSNVPHFRTTAEACAAAAGAEIANVALYDRYLAADLPFDVRNVFTNNRAASINRHLPAFNACK